MGEPQKIADQFLEAAVEPVRWLDVLQRVAAKTRSDHAQIVGVGPGYSFGFNWVNNMDASAHAAADRAEMMTPMTNYRVAVGVAQPVQNIAWEDSYDAIKPRLSGDAYLDLCSDLRIPFGCQTNLRVEHDGLVGFALLRSHRCGPTDAETRALFARYCPAAGAAVALQVALERDGFNMVAGAFEAMDIACFVLDRAMAVRAMSRAAEALLSDGSLRLADGRVASPAHAVQRRVAGATATVMQRRAPAASVAAEGPTGMLTLKVHRLPEREWNMGFAPFAILVAKRPKEGNAADLSLLREAYGLTATEGEIALLLRQGRSRAEICAMRGITHETMRSHLRSLFAKMGVKREPAAIHLLHALLS